MGRTTERRVIHGLRHRESGLMLRVAQVVSVLQDYPHRNEDTTYHLTLDEGNPVFDAGSLENLALAFGPTYGGSETRPSHAGYGPDDVEPVLVEEVLTTDTKPAGISFDLPVALPLFYTFDIRPAMSRIIPGLSDIQDTLAEFRADVESIKQPGGDFEWGRYSLVGVIARLSPEELPEDLCGSMVVSNSMRTSLARRALGAVEIPESYLNTALDRSGFDARRGSIVICLSDCRRLPDELAARLSERAAAPAPR